MNDLTKNVFRVFVSYLFHIGAFIFQVSLSLFALIFLLHITEGVRSVQVLIGLSFLAYIGKLIWELSHGFLSTKVEVEE